MSRLVVLSLGQGNLQDGFAIVTAQLGEADNPYRMKFVASLPAAPEIIELYHNWQLLYSALSQRLYWRLEIEKDDNFEIEEAYITNVSEVDITILSQRLSQRINLWLNSTEFRKIDQQLRTQLKPSEEIYFIIETNDNLLQRLPWHLWNFFEDYPYAEVALSAIEYQKPKKFAVKNQRNKVKILAICGNSTGIDISRDRSFLEKLSPQAEIEFLVEPNLDNLNDQLWQQGWDILFFAGHSCSKEKGFLQINQTDTITLEQLKYALKQAINRGLKLAIFNSCDGLGLAQQLQDLHIPQTIVMREPVPDMVAQEFLKHFLAEFSRGQSLYTTVRFARERLQAFERKFPCATWLPVIFQNPAAAPMIWLQERVQTQKEEKTGSSLASACISSARWIQTEMRSPSATQVISKKATLDSLLEILSCKLLETQNRPLNDPEILILRGIWQHNTYSKIAQEVGYNPEYFTNIIVPELCQRLSKLICKHVNKNNCRVLLESYVDAQSAIEKHIQEDISPCFPSGSVPLNSPFYVEHPVIEKQVYAEIRKPGALVRIKAPREMGKTSMLLRILDYGDRIGYRTVSLNLEQIDQAILSDLNRFLRWLCANIARQLQLEPKLDEYWDEDIGSKVSCSFYLRSYVLEQIDSPLILALDEVNQLFEHPQVAKEVLPLLRSWYEEAKRIPISQKLRLIVVHSTEIYVPLQLHQSPFNVGLPIQLTHFSLDQVQQLAQRYGLNWTDGLEAKKLMDLVGGHPALVHLALYHLSFREITLTQLLQTASTFSGIYHHHLQRHGTVLQAHPELAHALHTVMNSHEPVLLEPMIAYKLSSMGLIKLDNNKATPSCQLYRESFQPKFLSVRK